MDQTDTQRVISAIMDEEFDSLFDPNLQSVYGLMPSTHQLAARFDNTRQFRIWKYRTAKRYFKWVHKTSKYNENDKFFISRELFHALDEQPEPNWLKRRK